MGSCTALDIPKRRGRRLASSLPGIPPYQAPIKVQGRTLATLLDVKEFVLSLPPVDRADWGTAVIRLIEAADDPTPVRLDLAFRAIKVGLLVTRMLPSD